MAEEEPRPQRMLEGPYELFELRDEESIIIRVERYVQGSMIIHPRDEEKIIPALRVWIPRSMKPAGMPYYDITSKTLAAQLLPLIMGRDRERSEFKITKYGRAPKARFQIERIPIR